MDCQKVQYKWKIMRRTLEKKRNTRKKWTLNENRWFDNMKA